MGDSSALTPAQPRIDVRPWLWGFFGFCIPLLILWLSAYVQDPEGTFINGLPPSMTSMAGFLIGGLILTTPFVFRRSFLLHGITSVIATGFIIMGIIGKHSVENSGAGIIFIFIAILCITASVSVYLIRAWISRLTAGRALLLGLLLYAEILGTDFRFVFLYLFGMNSRAIGMYLTPLHILAPLLVVLFAVINTYGRMRGYIAHRSTT